MSGLPTKTATARFSVSSVSCVACTPAFRKGLSRSEGVLDVRELPMLNMVVVEFDPARTDEAKIRREVEAVSAKAGFKGKVIFPGKKKEVITKR
ncbi:MAG: hypothetical protein JRN21_02415 [Nitrososphaerota archaeon]|nr:hypothetical protein [Nitrososphaerota archaeon]